MTKLRTEASLDAVSPTTVTLPSGGPTGTPRGFLIPQAANEPGPAGTVTALDGEDTAVPDGSTAAVGHRAAAYVTKQGVTREQHKALGVVAQKMIRDGDEDGAGTALADALAAHPALDCTDPQAVLGHFLVLATKVTHSARLDADPRLSDPTYRVAPADGDDWFRYLHQAELAAHTAQTTGGAGNPDTAFHQRRVLALVQAHTQYWGSGHGRTLQAEYAAQLADTAAFLAAEAVTASLAGLQTNPHDVADRLHRAIDNAQGWHLAEVGGHSEPQAYADSRLHTATLAAHDALRASSSTARMARALRTALDMVIDEASRHLGAEPADTAAAEVPEVPEVPPEETVEDIAASLGAAVIEVDPANKPDGLKGTDVHGWYDPKPTPRLIFPAGQEPAERLAAARKIADQLKASE